jgi:malate dehydrogenase
MIPADVRLFGVTHLDIVRASTFVATVVGKAEDASKYSIPVIGGHAGATILPLLTQSEPKIVSLALALLMSARRDPLG